MFSTVFSFVVALLFVHFNFYEFYFIVLTVGYRCFYIEIVYVLLIDWVTSNVSLDTKWVTLEMQWMSLLVLRKCVCVWCGYVGVLCGRVTVESFSTIPVSACLSGNDLRNCRVVRTWIKWCRIRQKQVIRFTARHHCNFVRIYRKCVNCLYIFYWKLWGLYLDSCLSRFYLIRQQQQLAVWWLLYKSTCVKNWQILSERHNFTADSTLLAYQLVHIGFGSRH